MRSPQRRLDAFRTVRFEPFEPRVVLSTTATGELAADQIVQSSYFGSFSASNTDAFDLTGLTEALSNYDFTGEGQTVVIIDSGVAYNHTALGGGLGAGYSVVGGWDFAEGDADPYDDGSCGSHGTHVAGIIASSNENNPGVAPGVDIVALRVFNDAGQTQLSWVEQALQWVHDHIDSFENPITTVNLSLGSSTSTMSATAAAALEDELAQLAADGIFIAAAAGNSYASVGAGVLSYPASSSYVTAVGSVDSSGNLSYFTQRDDSMIAAPGRSINSTVPDYVGNRNGIDDDFAQYSGTSMASPFVAGAAILVREAYASVGYTNISAQTIYQTLHDSADLVYDSATGISYRRLNVASAIESALESVLPTAADDYGSTAATAHDVGRISGGVTLNGSITTAADCDYFTFTAASSGRVTVAVASTGGLDAKVQVASASTRQSSDGSLAFDVVAGNPYTICLQTAGGLGEYTLDIRLAAGSTALTEAVVVEQLELADQQISSSAKVYGLTAAYSGIFTVEASFQHSRGDVDLELVDSSGQRLAASTSNGGSERIDVTLAAGQTVYLRVFTSDGLTNSDVDLRITNLVAQEGGTLIVRGTSNADEFQIVAGAVYRVTINGTQYEISGSSISRICFDGQAGSDTATLYGTSGSDSAVLRVGSADLSGSGYSVSVISSESIEVFGRGGSDTVTLNDSSGNDLFSASPGYAAMTGSGFSLIARQFEVVYAYARYGGNDEASVSDSSGDDVFVASTDCVKMTGDDYLVRAKLFDTVHAYARNGGTDLARMTGSASADSVISTPVYTRLISGGAVLRTKFFEEVNVLGGGGNDRAWLVDSAGNDTLIARPDNVTLSGAGYANSLSNFSQVIASASSGGTNTALFYDSTGADAFFAGAAEARMSGSGYDNLARGFQSVTARATSGNDQATLYDSALADHLSASGDMAHLRSSALVAWVYDFDQVRAMSNSGGDDTAEISAVDYILKVSGPWDRE